VSKKGEPEVSDVFFDGIEKVKPSEEVMNVLESKSEEIVLIGPSNPITSIGPILSLRGIRQLLKHKKVVAISPIVGNEPISGPAGKFMRAKGFEVSPYGVFKCYEDFLAMFVIDKGSIRGTARAMGADKDSVALWLKRAGEHCEEVTEYLLRDLNLSQVQIDEIWTFIKRTKI
jgi:2-phospho-L-lactate transferase